MGGECLDDAALPRGDGDREQLDGHAVPDPTTLGRFLARFNLGHLGQLNRALELLFARMHSLVARGESVTLDLDSTLVEHGGPVSSRQGRAEPTPASSLGIRSAASSPGRVSGTGRR